VSRKRTSAARSPYEEFGNASESTLSRSAGQRLISGHARPEIELRPASGDRAAQTAQRVPHGGHRWSLLMWDVWPERRRDRGGSRVALIAQFNA
jgi:hypothetical protein